VAVRMMMYLLLVACVKPDTHYVFTAHDHG